MTMNSEHETNANDCAHTRGIHQNNLHVVRIGEGGGRVLCKLERAYVSNTTACQLAASGMFGRR
jgi:hypothetical protein